MGVAGWGGEVGWVGTGLGAGKKIWKKVMKVSCM